MSKVTNLERVRAVIDETVTHGAPRIKTTTGILRDIVARGVKACGEETPYQGTVAGWLRTVAYEAIEVAKRLDVEDL